MAKAPDLTDARAYAEAVAYGKLLAVREILDKLTAERPARNPQRIVDAALEYAPYWPPEYVDVDGFVPGYNAAFRVVHAMRLGVEK